MGLTDLFNKWIVERGSAVVHEKHLALFRDQLVAADKKILVLESEVATLTSENNELKATVEQLTKEKELLRQEIQKYHQPAHNSPLDNMKINILKLLFNEESMAPDQIAQSLDIALQMANFHLEELIKAKLIKPQQVMREKIENMGAISVTHHFGIPGYAIEQIGRKYLIETGKIT